MSMDKLFDSDKKSYVSPPINIGEFLDKAIKADARLSNFCAAPAFEYVKELLRVDGTIPAADHPTASDLQDCRLSFKYYLMSKGIESEQCDEVVNGMDDQLQELLMNVPVDNLQGVFPPKENNLKSLQALREFQDLPGIRQEKTLLSTRLKYHDLRSGEYRKGYAAPNQPVEADVVMMVHLVPPRLPRDVQKQSRVRPDVKLLIRGEMPLSKLRDKIFCGYDYFSNLHDFEDASNVKDYYINRYPSSFLFIHDTFYIDKRNPEAIDITVPIRSFMANHKIFGEPKVRDITMTKINDLTLRLGEPYVFVHIGDCEHLVVFTDLRRMHPTDTQALGEYPIFLYDRSTTPKCCICKTDTPAFIVPESDRIPHCPAFMCTNCFNAFNYNNDTRIGDFKAFHFIDQSIFE
uniref:snRNA-activating protein complex subunit 3 n=1 Tax=Panagrellus redivivus TaxID=6233 RepID=A0A7E4ZU57_PANRE